MSITKCISISREFEDLADEHKLSWSEAARVGMGVMLGDRGIVPYNNNLNLKRKIDGLVEEIQKLSAEKK